ncbi:MAG: tRNA (adenosine(37)-N6)-dimethylallyltransferase MiaA [Prevotella sp.]|nr:tRNA (adenosine(37)-N6)-dimethylallyltransferase MiaA [Prevotella sp.]MBR7049169.1 tRNA (adenosine(37)-N6)-dimethylallyltransferase MiaA [Prevotella sp.]
MKSLVVILGPTGVGKTELCLRLAESLHLPIINADSRQIFKEIPIGTAAPTAEQLQRVKHYFVGTHHIGDYYSASMYEQDVLNLYQQLVKDATNNGESADDNSPIALLTGGSMMYIDAVCNGIDDIPTIDEHTRAWMKKRLEDEGLPALVEELHQLDPEHWNFVDKNNPRRVVHALEICHMTGKTYTSFRKNEKKERPFRIVKIGLNRPREELYNRINQRVLSMIANGLEEEARNVFSFRNENALNTVGYKEMFEYFNGNITLDEAICKIQSNTRRYCRKQLTWFKRDTTIKWFSPNEESAILDYIRNDSRSLQTDDKKIAS